MNLKILIVSIVAITLLTVAHSLRVAVFGASGKTGIATAKNLLKSDRVDSLLCVSRNIGRIRREIGPDGPRLNVLPLANCSAPTSCGCSCSSMVGPPNVEPLQPEHVEHAFVLRTRCLQGLDVWLRLWKPQFDSVDRLSAPRCVTMVQKSAPNATNVTVR